MYIITVLSTGGPHFGDRWEFTDKQKACKFVEKLHRMGYRVQKNF